MPCEHVRRVHGAHLFVPAVRPDLTEKAARTPASAVIVDLEDSVPARAKIDARTVLPAAAETLRSAGKSVYVRVNNEDSLLAGDVSAALAAGVTGLVVPKVEDRSTLRDLDAWAAAWEQANGAAAGSVELELQIETPQGLLRAPELASALDRISSMMLGVEDFSTELGVDPEDPEADLQWAHAHVLLAAKAARIHAYGLIGAFSNYEDTAAYTRAARRSRAFGYLGAYCIHPAQVAIAVQAFTPTDRELAEARQVIDVYEAATAAGRSATSLHGRMIDRPIAERAERLLRLAAAQATPSTQLSEDDA